MNAKDRRLRASIKEYFDQLEIAVKGLEDVFEHCQRKPLENDYGPRDLERFDALAMRFSRTTDIFTQKILRAGLSLLREDEATFLDRARRIEKLGWVSSADDLIFMRDLRNYIAHEYVLEDWKEIFEQIMDYTPILLNDIRITKKEIHQKLELFNDR